METASLDSRSLHSSHGLYVTDQRERAPSTAPTGLLFGGQTPLFDLGLVCGDAEGSFVLVLSSSPPAHARQKLQSPEWRSCSALHANSLIKSPTDQPHRPWLLDRVEESARRSTGRLEAALYGGDILGGLRDCVNPLSCVYRFSAYLLHIVFFVSHSSYSLLKPAPTIHSLPADHLV